MPALVEFEGSVEGLKCKQFTDSIDRQSDKTLDEKFTL